MTSLALVMIARDEARCIERCLRSAAGVVDEMWVLDTGSVDDTPALARSCGAEVRHWRLAAMTSRRRAMPRWR